MIAAVARPPVWPLAQLILGLPVAAVWLVPELKSGRRWIARGRLEWRFVVAIGAVAVLALMGWRLLLAPPLEEVAAYIPALPLPLLAVGFVVFSVVNAILEEVVFRGLLQGALDSLLGAGSSASCFRRRCSVCVTGAAFPAVRSVQPWRGRGR